MAITLDADPDSSTFNCYCTVAYADDYHDARLFNENWTGATTGDKEKALLWATTTLGTLSWRGARTEGDQNLTHPRLGLSWWEYSEDGNAYETHDVSGFGYSTYVEVPSDTVALEVQDATAELALYMLEKDITAPDASSGYSEISVDTIKLKINPKDRLSWFNPSVQNLVWRFLKNSSAFNVPAMRVG